MTSAIHQSENAMSHPGGRGTLAEREAAPGSQQNEERIAGSWVLCRIGSERFALPIAAVSELLEEPALADMPALGDRILGMLVTRFGRLPVHDPARLLGHSAGRPVQAVLVIGQESAAVALAVDEAADTLELEDHMIKTLPALDDPFKLVNGVARDHLGLITVLDAGRLVRALASSEDAQ
jgi:chemotaxis signal transduction protein